MLFCVTAGKPSSRAIEHNRRSGDRARAQGHLLEPFGAILQAPTIAGGHLDIGKQMMGDEHGLRPLQMGISWHERVGVPLRQPDKGSLKSRHQIAKHGDLIAQIKPKI
jgi:hypothetical protein